MPKQEAQPQRATCAALLYGRRDRKLTRTAVARRAGAEATDLYRWETTVEPKALITVKLLVAMDMEPQEFLDRVEAWESAHATSAKTSPRRETFSEAGERLVSAAEAKAAKPKLKG